jgi:hypothetical protein
MFLATGLAQIKGLVGDTNSVEAMAASIMRVTRKSSAGSDRRREEPARDRATPAFWPRAPTRQRGLVAIGEF